MLGQSPNLAVTRIAEEIELLVEQVAHHLASRSDGTGSLLNLGTVLDGIGEVRYRLEICRSFAQTDDVLDTNDSARRLLLETLIQVTHLGGAEFYLAGRTLELFDSLLQAKSC